MTSGLTWLKLMTCGAISALLAGILPDRMVMYAAFVYTFLPIIMPVYGSRRARQRKVQFGLPELAEIRESPDQ